MVKYRILLFALLEIFVLPNSFAYFNMNSPTNWILLSLFVTPHVNAMSINYCSNAATSFSRYPNAVATMVPIRNQDRSCTIHLNNTGSNHGPIGTKLQCQGLSVFCSQSTNGPSNYNCQNVYLLVNEAKWERTQEGMIYYNFDGIWQVHIIGHDKHENFFDKIDVDSPSEIKGGRSSNTYKIIYIADFSKIYLNSASKQEIIDVSGVRFSSEVRLVLYADENDSIRGELKVKPSHLPATLECTDDFKTDTGNSIRDWQIIGRQNEADYIECTNYHMVNLLRGKIQVHADGKGGTSSIKDTVRNCMSSTLNPFTNYQFTYQNEVYSILADFNETAKPNSPTSQSVITLEENTVNIFFNSQNYLERILSMEYYPLANTLSLKILGAQNVIDIYVEGILRNQTINQFVGMNVSLDLQLRELPALSIRKKYPLGIFFPVLERPLNFIWTSSIDVTKFCLVKEMDVTSLDDAIEAYNKALDYLYRGDWHVEVMIKPRSGMEVFWFGTPVAENQLIFGAMKYIKAQNGSDSLELTDMMHEYVWIDNEAADGLDDTLKIDSKVCKDLQVQEHTANNQFIPRSEFDLVLMCVKNDFGSSGKLVLMDYLKDKSHRHLKILRDNAEYGILPKKWISPAQNDSDDSSLIRIIDLASSIAVRRPVIEPGSFWILWNKNEIREFDARSVFSNVLLFVKSTSFSIELKNFRRNGQISEEWRDKFLVIADDLSDDSPRIIRATEINNLLAL